MTEDKVGAGKFCQTGRVPTGDGTGVTVPVSGSGETVKEAVNVKEGVIVKEGLTDKLGANVWVG